MANATRSKYLEDMRAYALRHCGINSYRLDPKAIVLLYTVSDAGNWPAHVADALTPNLGNATVTYRGPGFGSVTEVLPARYARIAPRQPT